jgi:carboxynorspermidine decarboxylase
VPLYDPCAFGSRLGVRREQFEGQDLKGISGLHFHTLCEHNADALARTLSVFEEKFGTFLPSMEWVNFGGGHHITRGDYDVDLLCSLIQGFMARYPLQVYLEPGEAVALNAGILVTTVLDIVHNDMPIAILDTSVPTHMPDVLEMPYRPVVAGSGMPGEKPHTYRLTGVSCLAGDVVGEYTFDRPLHVGQKLAFLDMAHYTMVKTTTFNGVHLPSLALYDSDVDSYTPVREFGYEDYRSRLS